jgi:hypothetical protein
VLVLRSLRKAISLRQLPKAARAEYDRDRRGLLERDSGAEAVVSACLDWLVRAQDKSQSADGGVARDFSLVRGWATSYPETTGYIIPTMLAAASKSGRDDLRVRAKRMLDWLVAIQFPDGGIQGGKIDAPVKVPVTFNTGQVLLGFCAGVRTFEDYRDAMHAAARFLRDSLDPDGCWRRHPTPFAAPGEKAYETHVSWGLFEAERLAPSEGYGAAGLRQVEWALGKQQTNGWVADCCLNQPDQPLTHTLGYYLRGVVEAHRLSGEARFLEGARRTGDALMQAQRPDGSLAGRQRPDWTPAVPWTCVTGVSQIAESWFYLFETTSDERYAAAAFKANSFVRRTIRVDGPPDIRGGVKGAFPVDGGYGEFEYLNWAAKFTIDANVKELDLRPQHQADVGRRDNRS